MTDFGTSWRDGLAFIAIVNCIQPGTIDADAYRGAANRSRLEAAFQAAEQQLGIARLLDPEDVDVSKPDDKSIMTYVAQFLHKYPEPGKSKPPAAEPASVSAELQQYRDFVAWINSKNSLLEQLQAGKTQNKNYADFQELRDELQSRQRVLEFLRNLVMQADRRLAGVTYDSWQQVELSWQKLETHLRHWQWTLDTGLPGALGQLGEWLNNAEHLLCSEDLPSNFDDEAANALKIKLDEHRHFFSDLPATRMAFEAAVNETVPPGVSPQHLQDIASRLNALPEREVERAARLRFLEHKCCILAFLDLTESKLKAWSARYGPEETIVLMLEQYRAFVSRNKLFHEFEKAFAEMQLVAEDYKRASRGMELRELNEIDRFIYSSGERWRGLSTGLRCAQGILEEVLAYWKRWNAQCPAFEQWLDRAEPVQASGASEEEKMEFFQDVASWKDKYEQLGEMAAFLVTTCEPGVARGVKMRIDDVAARWEPLFERVRHYLHAGEILRHRREYRQGSERLEEWIVRANELLRAVPVGDLESMQRYGDELQHLYASVDDMELLLKLVSRHFQALVSEMAPDELQASSSCLKRQKETLVRVRSLIASRIQQYFQLRTQKESLEAGVKDVDDWLAGAEKALGSLSGLDCSLEATQACLERHVAFFAKSVNYKLLLDDKWKDFESMVRSRPTSPTVEQPGKVELEDDTKRKLEQLTDRFEKVMGEANEWELRLSDGVQRWRNYQEAQRLVALWIHRAETLFQTEKGTNAQQALEAHAAFFDASDEVMAPLETCAAALDAWLPDGSPVKENVSHSVQLSGQKVKRLLSSAPLHRMMLEFRLDEEAFNAAAKQIDAQLAAEQQVLTHSGVDTARVLEQHLEWFGDPPCEAVRQARALVERLERTAASLASDEHVQQTFGSVSSTWHSLVQREEATLAQLQAIPQKWTEYERKFAEMVQWMDSVDRGIAAVSVDSGSMEKYERLRGDFQAVCRDVDARREAMKWLVQRLDSLLSYKSEDEGNQAQQALEALIARYKALVQTIEATNTRMDLVGKCYACREDVRKVCQELGDIQKEIARSDPAEEEGDLDSIDSATGRQEGIIKQLDNQRAGIVSLLQRGRDLQHHQSAPEFLAQEVQHLEHVWNKTNAAANEKLKKLKGKLSNLFFSK